MIIQIPLPISSRWYEPNRPAEDVPGDVAQSGEAWGQPLFDELRPRWTFYLHPPCVPATAAAIRDALDDARALFVAGSIGRKPAAPPSIIPTA